VVKPRKVANGKSFKEKLQQPLIQNSGLNYDNVNN